MTTADGSTSCRIVSGRYVWGARRTNPMPSFEVGRMSMVGKVLALLAVLLLPAVAWGAHNNPHLVGGPHKLPVRGPDALTTQAAPPGAHLTYYGGRVVSNLQVVQVLWGTGNYLPQVSSTASPSIATF